MIARTLASLALAAALAGASIGCRAEPDAAARTAPAKLGLMTTLPLYWAEASEVGELLQGQQEPRWVRQALETRFLLEPLDTLDTAALGDLRLLMLAQPRALAPEENVALDAWVRRGGRLLLFADPMLTLESRFGMGDKRRPQDVILLSPILTHWGLELSFDPSQPAGERMVTVDGREVPVDLAGILRTLPGGTCEIVGEAVLARCRVGEGSITVLADGAVLDDPESGDTRQRRAAVLELAALAFD